MWIEFKIEKYVAILTLIINKGGTLKWGYEAPCKYPLGSTFCINLLEKVGRILNSNVIKLSGGR